MGVVPGITSCEATAASHRQHRLFRRTPKWCSAARKEFRPHCTSSYGPPSNLDYDQYVGTLRTSVL
jgi:hypothetical protein